MNALQQFVARMARLPMAPPVAPPEPAEPQADQRAMDISNVPSSLWRSVTGTTVEVTPHSALGLPAFYACVRVLAESIASLPLKLYRRVGDGKSVAADHKLYSVLHDMPNAEMTAFEFWEMMVGHVCLRGNAYGEIEMNGRADILALWPLNPAFVRVSRDEDAGLVYLYQEPGKQMREIPAYRMFHIKGMGSNGVVGFSPIQMMRRSLGLALTIEEMAQSVYNNGAIPRGALEYPQVLSEKALRTLRDSWNDVHGGPSNAGKPALLENGVKWVDVGMNMQDAQFIESRKLSLADIARMFRIPLHMIGDLDKATFSNIEHQSLEFVIHTLRPWLVRIERAITRDLIGVVERRSVFAEFSVEGLLRGDIQSRYNAYNIGRNGGWLSRNDIRRIENQNPIEGGDDYLTPLNMSVLGQPAPAGATDTQRAMDAWALDIAQRVRLRMDTADAGRHQKWMIDIAAAWCRAVGVPDVEMAATTFSDLVLRDPDGDIAAHLRAACGMDI